MLKEAHVDLANITPCFMCKSEQVRELAKGYYNANKITNSNIE